MGWIRRTKRSHLFFAFVLGFAGVLNASEALNVFIRDDVLANYQRFVGERDVTKITDFSGQYLRRDVVDMVIAQQALQKGGFDKTFIFTPGFVSFRESNLLEKGEQLLHFDSYWKADLENKGRLLFISEPVIQKGQYFAGIYHGIDNQKVKQLKEEQGLTQLTSVSNPKWQTDWQTLESLPLKQLHAESDWMSQARMVSKGWVDFMLMPLMPKRDNRFVLEDVELIANEHLVVLLNDSRHFAVSRLHPEGERAFAALQKGLAILREQGRITSAYQQAGLIPDLNKYQVVNPTQELR
ncbi:hypothetical protein CKO50_04325 [Pseudoalteromonas sp. HM-SA03]|uniref:hypothetical protein n=1 Tax=Pseudoalteromonas sp. HM-SA03 TaxID=2029678 RepID=UPI000BAE1798|nr:hypothetical protein [Pseudoalteromonas sp. HM-SA03]PAY02462.1 hypothetical protein CKO50_04325 [Pseudoalteromonas sp. HM-SA03]